MFQFLKNVDDLKPNQDTLVGIIDRFRCVEELLDTYKERFKFPYYFGHNWDALSDCMRDLDWIQEKNVTIVHATTIKYLDYGLGITYVDVLKYILEFWENYTEKEVNIFFLEEDKELVHAYMFEKNIYNNLFLISHIEYQKRIWLQDKKDDINPSSYSELMSQLFGNNEFNSFVESIPRERGFDSILTLELLRLKEVLNSYNAKKTDKKIIKDPKWLVIVSQAKRVITLWNKYMGR